MLPDRWDHPDPLKRTPDHPKGIPPALEMFYAPIAPRVSACTPEATLIGGTFNAVLFDPYMPYSIVGVNIPAGARLIVVNAYQPDDDTGIATTIDLDGVALTRDSEDGQASPAPRVECWSLAVPLGKVAGVITVNNAGVEAFPFYQAFVALYQTCVNAAPVDTSTSRAGSGTHQFNNALTPSVNKALIVAPIVCVGRSTDTLGTINNGFSLLGRVSSVGINALDIKCLSKVVTAGGAHASDLTLATGRSYVALSQAYKGA